MNQEKIGKFIANLRKEKKMTQQDLANILGVSDRTISKWENGRGLPDLSLLIPLSTALDVSINDLLSGEIIKKANYEKELEKNVVNIINKVNKKNNTIINILIILISLFILIILIFFLINATFFKQEYNRKKMFVGTQDNMLVFTTSYAGEIKHLTKKYNNENIIFLSLITSIKDNIYNKNNDSINHVFGLNNINENIIKSHYKVYYTNISFSKIKKANQEQLANIINKSILVYEN